MLSSSFCPKIHAVHLLQGLHASQFFGARFFSRRTYKKKTDTVTFLHTLYKLKDIYYNDLWKCLNWRLSPKLYWQLLEFNFGRLCV